MTEIEKPAWPKAEVKSRSQITRDSWQRYPLDTYCTVTVKERLTHDDELGSYIVTDVYLTYCTYSTTSVFLCFHLYPSQPLPQR